MAELKPCPFCGGKARFSTRAHLSRYYLSGWEFSICCSKCNVVDPTKWCELIASGKKGGNPKLVLCKW